MIHQGLPSFWAWGAMAFMLLVSIILWQRNTVAGHRYSVYSLTRLPFIGGIFSNLKNSKNILITLRVLVAVIFILAVSAGLLGSQIAERNLATTLTWTLWWSAVVIAVFFVGSLWCAICPWDTIASWLVKQRLLTKRKIPYSLAYKVPASLRNLSIASFLFILMTWLELGYGITVSPYATSMMALVFVAMAVSSMLIFERKAFCQYFCPVGRTLGMYSEFAMTALRPIDNDVCANCKTLECYHGNDEIEACPTHQVMGRLQHSLCISCGQCVLACPHSNISWAFQNPETELAKGAREGISESLFMLIVLALTLFHGFTMLPIWSSLLNSLAAITGDSGRLLMSFSILMFMVIVLVIGTFAIASWMSSVFTIQDNRKLNYGPKKLEPFVKQFKQTFSNLGFATLPLTFAYHVAHNLTHLFRESRGFGQVVLNPFGLDMLPLSSSEVHLRHTPMVSETLIYIAQLSLLVIAFTISIRIAIKRIEKTAGSKDRLVGLSALLPQVIFLLGVSGLCLWLLSQPMKSGAGV